MTRALLAVALACGLLAGCATPRDMFAPAPETPGGGFTYVAESYDLFPTRRAEGEARRLQDLEAWLASSNLCAAGYAIDEREETMEAGGWFSGPIFRVAYRGHCQPPPAAEAPAASS